MKISKWGPGICLTNPPDEGYFHFDPEHFSYFLIQGSWLSREQKCLEYGQKRARCREMGVIVDAGDLSVECFGEYHNRVMALTVNG